MEGLSVEWRKGEDYQYGEGDRDYRYGEGDRGKMSWVWNKGIESWKKILFGGAVVSSAPLLLPPLVVISVLGVALSVPYGILLGSYACTEKLMSMLLPPPAPIFSGYGTVYYYDDDDGDGEDMCYGGVMDEEREVVEMRIGLVGEGEGLEDYSYEHEENVRFDEEEKMVMPEVTETFKGMRKENVEEIFLDEEWPVNRVEGINVVIEGDELVDTLVQEVVIEGDNVIDTVVEEVETPCEEAIIVVEQSINEQERDALECSGDEEVDIPCKITAILVEECRNLERESDTEDDELARGTRGLLERIRDEGRDDTKEEMHGGAGDVDRDSYSSIDKIELPIEAKSVEEALGENKEMRELRHTEIIWEEVHGILNNESAITLNMEMLGKITHDQGTVIETETPIEAKVASNGSVIIDERIHEEVPGENEMREIIYSETIETTREEADATGAVGSSFVEEEPKPMLKGGITGKSETEDSRLSRIAGESDGINAAGQRGSHLDYETPEESESSQDTEFGSQCSLEQPVTIRVLEAKTETETESPISSRKDITLPSNESPNNEQTIWEQIRAMRTIVGYKGAIHGTCIEEVKALYIFTGIEPPASIQDASDLVEVKEKLGFLMSIVGVK